MFKFGVSSLIWTEKFLEKDLYVIPKAKILGFEAIDILILKPDTFPTKLVKEKAAETDVEIIISTGLDEKTNLISPDPVIRQKGIQALKSIIDICIELGSKILAGTIYAAWGYITGEPRTEQEWEWSVKAMREVARYAEERSEMIIAVEYLNRFETHFLNVAEDAVRYCKDVGIDNMKVHVDTFHVVREETSFRGAVEACGKKYFGYIHAGENNRGIPGTGLVPWKEFFTAIKDIGYTGPLVIESYDPSFKEINRLAAIWRKFADSGESLALQGLKNLKAIADEVYAND
jgi:D-psicose/D-tagatose/L-ribulose 3-epimerase